MPILAAATLAVAPIAAEPAFAKEPVYQSFLGTAIDGTDPVAYFTEGRPVEGSSDYTHEWNGATWRFSSADNLAKFSADPAKYAPQYGGYCAWAVAQGYTASTDPNAWRIVDGKLYLNYNADVQTRWEADIPGHITSADGNWPEVLN
ncbi:MAG: YHS domain-containing (seleno)protein [Pseudomonadota bacterium]